MFNAGVSKRFREGDCCLLPPLPDKTPYKKQVVLVHDSRVWTPLVGRELFPCTVYFSGGSLKPRPAPPRVAHLAI